MHINAAHVAEIYLDPELLDADMKPIFKKKTGTLTYFKIIIFVCQKKKLMIKKKIYLNSYCAKLH